MKENDWSKIGEYGKTISVSAKSTNMVYVPLEIIKEGNNTFEVKVTAEDKTTTKTYTVTCSKVGTYTVKVTAPLGGEAINEIGVEFCWELPEEPEIPVHSLFFTLLKSLHDHIAEPLGGGLHPMLGSIKFRVAITPTIIVFPADLTAFQLCNLFAPGK